MEKQLLESLCKNTLENIADVVKQYKDSMASEKDINKNMLHKLLESKSAKDELEMTMMREERLNYNVEISSHLFVVINSMWVTESSQFNILFVRSLIM